MVVVCQELKKVCRQIWRCSKIEVRLARWSWKALVARVLRGVVLLRLPLGPGGALGEVSS